MMDVDDRIERGERRLTYCLIAESGPSKWSHHIEELASNGRAIGNHDTGGIHPYDERRADAGSD